jgi:hypothetical protein
VGADATARAIARWNRLSADEADPPGTIDLEIGGRPLCTVLRPHLVEEGLLAGQARAAGLVLSAVRRARKALAQDEELYRLHLGGLHDWIGRLLALEPKAAGEGALVRLDASLARTRLHFIEVNADTPQGAGHNDAILDFFERLPTYRRFSREYELRPLRVQAHQLDALLGTWREWGGSGSPTIAIVTLTEDPVRLSGVELDRDFYGDRGVNAVIADPRDLSFAGGKLRVGEDEIDVVHRVMLTGECLDRADEMRPMMDAVRAGAVCLVNPFRSELLGHKAVFALITDPEHDFGLSGAEREAVREHVPWSRPVIDGRTTDPHGKEVDLVEHVRAERRQLVLKPAHDFGGHGVQLGWRQDEAGWERSIQLALEHDFVVQRRVPLQREEYPAAEPGRPPRTLYEDTDPYMFRGEFGGLLTRLGTSEITNVHADGSVCASVAFAPRA